MTSPAIAFVTDFADQGVILPLVGTVAVALALQRRWRVVAAWLGVVGAVLGTILLLKVVCYSCGWMIPVMGPGSADIRSPSGHVASAAVVYTGLAALLLRGLKSAAGWVALVVAAAIALLVGWTRIELGAHSPAEVEIAAVVGVTGALAFVLLAGQALRTKSGFPILLAAAAIVTAMHGTHLPAEAVIQVRGVAFVRTLITSCKPDRQQVHRDVATISVRADVEGVP